MTRRAKPAVAAAAAPPQAQRLPWQAAQWREIAPRIAADRLPHALLLHGPRGVGKLPFALRMIHAALCRAAAPERQRAADDAAACLCPSCACLRAGSHPDFYLLRPEEEGGRIKVGALRELLRGLTLTPRMALRKAALIDPADALTPSAANGLLKTLEEPPGEAVVALLSAAPDRLPATIRSRCQRIAFPPPPRAAARRWLASRLPEALGSDDLETLLDLTDDAPLRALQLADADLPGRHKKWLEEVDGVRRGALHPVLAAQRWAADDAALNLDWLRRWLTARIRAATAEAGGAARSRPLFRLLDQSDRALRLLETSVNPRLLLEELLLDLRGR